MKKIFTLLTLLIYLGNLSSYWLVQLRIMASDANLESELNKEVYHDNNLIKIKIPLHLPYWTNGIAYERVDGQVKIGGLYYNYVKRMIKADTLYLLCIPNETKTAWCNVATNLFQLDNQHKKTLKLRVSNNKTDLQQSQHKSNFAFNIRDLSEKLFSGFSNQTDYYINPVLSIDTQPPEA